MPNLIYSMSVSLDGYTAGPDGGIEWSAPDEELHRFHNEQTRELGAHLAGRRLYEDMLPWETEEQPDETRREFADVWSSIEKIVFSRTLTAVHGNARLATDGIAEEVARLRERSDKDIAIGGPTLAADAIRSGLIDEYRLFTFPVVVGGGTPFFPPLDAPADLVLVETRTFGSRVVYARYQRAG